MARTRARAHLLPSAHLPAPPSLPPFCICLTSSNRTAAPWPTCVLPSMAPLLLLSSHALPSCRCGCPHYFLISRIYVLPLPLSLLRFASPRQPHRRNQHSLPGALVPCYEQQGVGKEEEGEGRPYWRFTPAACAILPCRARLQLPAPLWAWRRALQPACTRTLPAEHPPHPTGMTRCSRRADAAVLQRQHAVLAATSRLSMCCRRDLPHAPATPHLRCPLRGRRYRSLPTTLLHLPTCRLAPASTHLPMLRDSSPDTLLDAYLPLCRHAGLTGWTSRAVDRPSPGRVGVAFRPAACWRGPTSFVWRYVISSGVADEQADAAAWALTRCQYLLLASSLNSTKDIMVFTVGHDTSSDSM